MEKPRILAADVPNEHRTLQKVLDGLVTLVPVTTIDDALSALHASIDAIICGIHFDESRMFDLIRMAKAEMSTRSVPIICYRDLESGLSPALFESLEIACRAQGAESFVDLYALRERLGAAQADEEFRRIVMASVATGRAGKPQADRHSA